MTFTAIKLISWSQQNLRKMEEDTEEPGRDLNELQNADWVGFHTSDP